MDLNVFDKVCEIEMVDFEFSLKFIHSISFSWEVSSNLSIEIGRITEALLYIIWLYKTGCGFVGLVGV